MTRPQIMMAAFDVIKENIPDLEALNLNDNKLHMLDHFKLLDKKAPNLKILYMANNKIPYVTALDSLKNLALVEINLEGNQLKECPSIRTRSRRDGSSSSSSPCSRTRCRSTWCPR